MLRCKDNVLVITSYISAHRVPAFVCVYSVFTMIALEDMQNISRTPCITMSRIIEFNGESKIHLLTFISCIPLMFWVSNKTETILKYYAPYCPLPTRTRLTLTAETDTTKQKAINTMTSQVRITTVLQASNSTSETLLFPVIKSFPLELLMYALPKS